MKMNAKNAAFVIGLFILLVAPACADQLTISGITPNAGYNNTSVFITNLQGTNFTINTQASLVRGAVTINPTGSVHSTPTQIQCTFDLTGQPAGMYNVTIDESINLSNNATLSNGFTVFAPPPALLTITPQTGINGAALPPLPFVLTGTGLLMPGAVVNLSRSSTNITASGLVLNVNGSVSGTFSLAGATNGTWNVTWKNNDGNVSNSLPFNVTNPMPTISSISPTNSTTAQSNQGVTITGTGFISGASVAFSQGLTTIPLSVPTTWVDAQHINAGVNLVGTPVGPYNVTVYNPDLQNVTSINAFRVFYPAPPVITPPTVPTTAVNNAPVNVTVTGTGFQQGLMINLIKGVSNVVGTNVTVGGGGTTINCTFDITGQPTGAWTVKVANNDSQFDQYNNFIITAPPSPVASFITNTSSGSAPLTVRFNDTSINNPTMWNWNFGDGNTTTTQNATHTFGVGTWVVQLNASNAYGSNITVPGTTITVNPPPLPPVANFTASPTAGFAPLFVQFTDTSFSGILNWTWDLDTSSHIIASAQNPSFTYNQPGSYNVSLMVTNTSGTATTIKSNFIIVTTKPVANFTGTPLTGTIPLTVQFTDYSTNSTSWHWDFGDGSNSTNQSPSHVYTVGGTYTVSLVTDNAGGNSDPFVRNAYVTALPPVPIANPGANVTSGFNPLTVQLLDNSTDTPTTFLWNFADNSTSADRNPVHIFVNPGIYNVSEYVVNIAGNSTGYIIINVTAPPVPPVANFTGSPRAGFIPLTVQFNDTSQINITSWQWKFGPDLFTAGSQNPVFTYNEVGNFTVNLTVTNASGQSTVSKPGFIIVTNEPEANFTADRTSGNIPLFVNFTDHSTDATAWFWDFGDGTNSTLQNPGHLYNATGQFTVTMTPSNAGGSGNPLAKPDYITVHVQPPAADFTAVPLSGDKPLNVQFNDTSAGNPTSWNWDFGDGNTSTLQNPSYTYVTVGVYNVTMEAINDGGNSIKEKDNYITVTQPRPVAGFGVNRTSGTIPFDVTFVDESTNNPTGWAWNFGDGGNSTLQNPVHRYTTAGNFTVIMKASNSGGISNNTAFITINALMPPPVANFTGTPTIGTLPLTVQFTDTSTNTPLSWVWDFGDGTFAGPGIKNPVHTYNKVGSFNVSLTVVNSGGSSSLTRPAFITVTRSPFADFTANPTTGISPLLVRFTDQSTGKPFLFYWTFGDGLVSTDKNPVHVYQKPGNYTVTETVQNFFGTSKKIKQDYIVISARPVAAFTTNPVAGLSPLDVQFVDTSAGNPTSWNWNFGDSTTSTLENPLHTYTAGGVYSVKLTVTNGIGSDSVTKSQLVSVSTPINADFTYKPAEGNVPLTVVFTDTSTGNPFSYTWNFGDNIISNDHNPVHTYLKSGVYNVTLNVLSAQGSGKVTKPVTVTKIPVAHFKAIPLNGSAPLTVQFTDTSANGPMNEWFWSFGDGQFSSDQNPSHTYNSPGQYSVTLHVTNDDGSDELIQHNLITVKPFP